MKRGPPVPEGAWSVSGTLSLSLWSFALIYVLVSDVTRVYPSKLPTPCVHKGSGVILSRP